MELTTNRRDPAAPDYRLIGRRIADARRARAMTQRELGAYLEVADATISRWESGTHDVSIPDLNRIAAVLEQPLAFFLHGEDGPAPLPTIEREPEELLREAIATLERRKSQATLVPLDQRSLTYVRLLGTIPAGYPSLNEEGARMIGLDLDEEQRDRLTRAARIPYALSVRGDSMAPDVLDGEIVIIDREREARSGDIVAASVDGETLLKRFIRQDDQAILRSANPDRWPDLVIRDRDRGVIQGVAVSKVTKPTVITLTSRPASPPPPDYHDEAADG